MTKQHIELLRVIIDNYSHKITIYDAREAIETLRDKIGEDDFEFEFDGNEYRIIADSAIWTIYVEEIKQIVEDCYDLKLENIPDFVAWSIDWEQTAKNAYVDGYGHTFSTYDGSEYNAGGYYIFRIN